MKEGQDRAEYPEAIRLNPNDAETYYNRGNAYFGKGEYDKAIADFTQAIRINPDYAAAYNSRGNAYYCKGEYDKAHADYVVHRNKILTEMRVRYNKTSKPKAAEAYNNRGVADKDKGE